MKPWHVKPSDSGGNWSDILIRNIANGMDDILLTRIATYLAEYIAAVHNTHIEEMRNRELRALIDRNG